MPSVTEFKEERAELETILASGVFSRAPGLAQLLGYVCNKYFEGEASRVKEYNIAVEALGRPADFDQKRDSIVRVEAHRLRRRLALYYQGEGALHGIRIELPPGQYVPLFVPQSAVEPAAVHIPAPPENAPPSPPGVAMPPQRRRKRSAVALMVLTALFAAAVVTALVLDGKRPVVPVPAVAGSLSAGDEIRIVAGRSEGAFTDQLGGTWSPDQYFTGGTVSTFPGRPVNGTRDMALFQTAREGDFQYDIPLKAGNYELHLYFAELLYGERNPAGGGETSRLFHVDVNGKRLLAYFDIVSDAGGPGIADERVFKDISPAADGQLHIKFTHAVRDPILNAIRISPAPLHHMRPVRIVMREQAYTDKNGNLWEADHYYQGGQLVFRPRHVEGADDPGLYLSERYGNLTYTIPVAPGVYSVNMKFAENWFGAGKPVGGGAGNRRFDIFCNGVALARNFDIFREAGGSDRAVDRTFRGLQPNAQGKLIISLVPIENYASIHALSVIDQGM